MLSDMIVIKTWTLVTLFACTAYGQRKPPNYQQNEMPETSFSCKDKIIGGYYADPETSCQMFHVCVSVAGTGVQDFRFLCPNDTAFDQENQICDDWYNIDCEAATLYYSDNFDLYRLGSGGASVTSGKVTPIPLGPSSPSPAKVQQPKPRKPSLSAPVNNAVSENDDDYYLQRSDVTDSRQHQDLLRGSSSGNFFSSRNRGVENPDDYDDTRATSTKDVPKKNTKAPFRKLLTGKKPNAESPTTTAASSTTESLQWSTTTTTVRQPNYKPTTYRSKDRGRINYKTYLDKQAKADENDYQKIAKPATNVQSTTFAPISNTFQSTTARVNNVYQTTQINNAETYVQANANQPKNNDFLRIVPSNNNNNNNNNNGFQSNRINVAPVNNNHNFQSNNVFPANNNNNNFQANNEFSQTNGPVVPQGFQQLNNANQNFQKNINYNQGFQSEKIFPTTTQNYNPTVYQQQQGGNTFQQGANIFQQNGNNFQQDANTFHPGNTFQSVSSTTTQKYNAYQSPTTYQQSTNVFQSSTPYNTAAGNSFQQVQFQTSQSPQLSTTTTTEHFSKDFRAKFDPYNSYHQRTIEEPGETLKTAPSTNLRPSELNALLQPKPKSINATLSVGYSFNKADGGVAKSTVVVPAPTTQKPRPFTTQPAVTTPLPTSSTRTTSSSAAKSSTKKAVTKDKDSSYDYAYYDDSNHNDYTDVVPEEFSRIQSGNKF